jgi:hypothetical protein
VPITFTRAAFAGPDIQDGIYPAKFIGCKEGPAGNYGPTARWLFEVQNEDEFIELDMLTGVNPSPKSKAGQVIAVLANRQLEVDESINDDDLIGRKVRVLVTHNEKGYPTIERVMPAAAK